METYLWIMKSRNFLSEIRIYYTVFKNRLSPACFFLKVSCISEIGSEVWYRRQYQSSCHVRLDSGSVRATIIFLL